MNRRPQKSRSSYDAFSPAHAARFKASSPDSTFFEKRRRRSPILYALGCAAALLALVLMINAVANCFVRLIRVEVPVTGLTEAFADYRILHISDLKGASFGRAQSGIVSACKDEDVDLIVLTGDMVSPHGDAQPLYALLDALDGLDASTVDERAA